MKSPWKSHEKNDRPHLPAGASEAQADQQALDEAKVFRQKLLDEGQMAGSMVDLGMVAPENTLCQSVNSSAI